MANLLDLCSEFPIKSVPAGEMALEENLKDGEILILKSGAVEIVKHGSVVATISTPGAMLGEIAVLLDCGHSASARAVHDSEFYVLEHAGEKLAKNPILYREIAYQLARRLVRLSAKNIELQERLEVDRLPGELSTLAIMWGFE